MKRLFRAFTLAEVLITLGIVGLVARVTLPALIQNVQEQQVEASLLKAINTLETGNQKILTDTGVKSLAAAGLQSANNERQPDELSPARYFALMNNYMNGTLRSMTLTINGVNQANSTAYITKDGILYTSGSSIEVAEPLPRAQRLPGVVQQIRNIPQKYHGSYAKLLVDINGVSGPNQLAKDQFLFYVDNYGAVIPYGGAEYERYARTNVRVFMSGTVPRWTNLCAAGQTPSTVAARAACTGSIVDNHFKIIYTY